MQNTLEEIFRAIFELPAQADVTGLTQKQHAAWDSLAHVTLIGAIESEFDLSIDVADSMEITSFDAARRYLESQGK
ncbi:MAG: acyl carrier protein [Gemmatimonadaceae bacterium]|nr:acyl carrier protein [Gemmatimonadaceae bacterium]